MATFQRYMVVAGVTVLIAIVGCVLLLGHSPFDTGLRGGARGAVAAAGFLEILWVAVAVTMAVVRWRTTTAQFRLMLLLNGIVVSLLLADFFR